MARRQWQVLVRHREHRIELEHGYFSARRRIWVDSEELAIPEDEQQPFPDFGGVYPIDVDGVPCVVVIENNGFTFSYDLLVEGISRKTGQPVDVSLRRAPVLNGAAGIMLRHPTIGLAFFAVAGIVAGALFVSMGIALASRPDHPLRIAVGHSGRIPEDAWVTLEGLALDCSAGVRLSRGYLFAGSDEQGVPVYVMQTPDACASDELTGTMGDARGTDGAALRRLTREPRVRVLATDGGPANELIGLLLCGGFASVSAAMAVLFARESRRQRRRAARMQLATHGLARS